VEHQGAGFGQTSADAQCDRPSDRLTFTILRAATGIAPILTPLAAVGLAVIMGLAIPFHIMRDEANGIALHIVLVGLRTSGSRGGESLSATSSGRFPISGPIPGDRFPTGITSVVSEGNNEVGDYLPRREDPWPTRRSSLHFVVSRRLTS
jgi:hypothetical protein